jgi:hypothetical protein
MVYAKIVLELMESKLYYGLICLNIGIDQRLSVEVCHIEFKQICETVYGIYGIINSWPYLNLALLWISEADNHNCPKLCSKSVPYRSLRIFV